ncbi:MAG: hypothetical protein JOZ64_14505 [Solirubrobacterales bacterium]|nr:hypothetical protein [Solirubrobacterales bacterium]
MLVNAFFLIPMLASTQLRPGVAAAVTGPAVAALIAAQNANAEPWASIALRTWALAALSLGCVLLSWIQRSPRADDRWPRTGPNNPARRPRGSGGPSPVKRSRVAIPDVLEVVPRGQHVLERAVVQLLRQLCPGLSAAASHQSPCSNRQDPTYVAGSSTLDHVVDLAIEQLNHAQRDRDRLARVIGQLETVQEMLGLRLQISPGAPAVHLSAPELTLRWIGRLARLSP